MPTQAQLPGLEGHLSRAAWPWTPENGFTQAMPLQGCFGLTLLTSTRSTDLIAGQVFRQGDSHRLAYRGATALWSAGGIRFGGPWVCHGDSVLATKMKKRKSKFLQQPIQHLNLKETKSLLDLVQAFQHTSFQSRNLFKCFEVFRQMLDDPTCIIFLGVSGAMIPGGMRRVIRDMIEMKLIDVMVSTGANIFHDLFESFGYRHYVGSEEDNDDALRRHRIVRVYDALMDDHEINRVIHFLSKVPEKLEEKVTSSRRYLEVLGGHLTDEESILKTASRYGLPIFIPALSDSSIGIGLTFLYLQERGSSEGLVVDQIRDNFEIAQLKKMASATGAIYIGGGVPKNYIQQLGPVSELLFQKERGHQYAFQITTDDPKWGGLSGCTFEEAKSWGKLERRSSYSAVYVDATVALPLLVGAILQDGKVYRKRKRRRFCWEGEKLKSIQFI